MTYEKNGQTLEEADAFIYEEDIYKWYPNRFELARTRKVKSRQLLKKTREFAYSEDHGCQLHRYLDLIAAPKAYLINAGFKLKL